MNNVIYANARAKALENKLIDSEKMKQLRNSNSSLEALNLLKEFGFGNNINVANPLDFERLIEEETKLLFDFIKDICPDKDITKFFLVSNDYHNLEVLYKHSLNNVDYNKMLKPVGLFKVDDLKNKVMSKNYDGLTNFMISALKECNEFIEKNGVFKAGIDYIFKKYQYLEMQSVSTKFKDLSEILAFKIDTQNILTAFRLKDFDNFKSEKLFGGKLNDKVFKTISELDENSNIAELKQTYCFDVIQSAFLSFKNKKPFTEAEKIIDSFAINYFNKTKYEFYDLKPFITYIYYKLAELENVRIVMVGLINNIEKNEIEKRLRAGYEG